MVTRVELQVLSSMIRIPPSMPDTLSQRTLQPILNHTQESRDDLKPKVESSNLDRQYLEAHKSSKVVKNIQRDLSP